MHDAADHPATWRRLAKVAHWPCETDRDALTVYCGLMTEAEANLAEMQTSRISVTAMTDLTRMLAGLDEKGRQCVRTGTLLDLPHP
jgi:hypothetical protein